MAKRGPKPKLSEERILEVAAKLILERGISALSMSAIARELGTVVSGLYRYFDSLDAVYIALQLQAIAQYEASFVKTHQEAEDILKKRATTSESADALFRILFVFKNYLQMATKHPVAQALVDAFLSSPEPMLQDADAVRMNTELQKIFSVCESSLRQATECGALSPGDNRQRVQTIWAGLHGLEQFRKRDRILPEELQVAAIETAMLRSLLLGFGAQASELELAHQQLGKVLG